MTHNNGFRDGVIPPAEDLTKIRDEQIKKISKHIILKVAEHIEELPLIDFGGMSKDEAQQVYRKFYTDHIADELAKFDMRLADATFLSTVIYQPFELVCDVIARSMEEAANNLGSYLWGIKYIDDLKISDIIRVQQKKMAEGEATPVKADPAPKKKKKGERKGDNSAVQDAQ